MSSIRDRKENARAERIIPGVWRLRIPLPWPGVPHVNAFALTHGDGIVLVDTGTGPDGDPHQLEMAFSQLDRELSDVSLLVCTHSHVDHYGLAKAVVDASGAELWMHPAWEHVRDIAENQGQGKLEIARQSGVPDDVFAEYERNQGTVSWIGGIVEPDRDLVDGVVVNSDLGDWTVCETPGHAPSQVVLHQPDRKLMLSGDHLLGRVSLFFDYGHTPDPVGEFLASLDRVSGLDTGLVLAGHGRPFRDPPAKIAATRSLVEESLNHVRSALAAGPATAYDLLSRTMGPDRLSPAVTGYALQVLLAYLDHLRILGEADVQSGTDPPIWHLV